MAKYYLVTIPNGAIMPENATNWLRDVQGDFNLIKSDDKIIVVAGMLDNGCEVAQSLGKGETTSDMAMQIVDDQNERYRKMLKPFFTNTAEYELMLDQAYRKASLQKNRKWELAGLVAETYSQLSGSYVARMLSTFLVNRKFLEFPMETFAFRNLRVDESTFDNSTNRKKLAKWMKIVNPNNLVVTPGFGKTSGISLVTGSDSVSEIENLFVQQIEDLEIIRVEDGVLA